jgi:hypothetical protein
MTDFVLYSEKRKKGGFSHNDAITHKTWKPIQALGLLVIHRIRFRIFLLAIGEFLSLAHPIRSVP